MINQENSKKCPCDDGAMAVKKHTLNCKYFSTPKEESWKKELFELMRNAGDGVPDTLIEFISKEITAARYEGYLRGLEHMERVVASNEKRLLGCINGTRQAKLKVIDDILKMEKSIQYQFVNGQGRVSTEDITNYRESI